MGDDVHLAHPTGRLGDEPGDRDVGEATDLAFDLGQVEFFRVLEIVHASILLADDHGPRVGVQALAAWDPSRRSCGHRVVSSSSYQCRGAESKNRTR